MYLFIRRAIKQTVVIIGAYRFANYVQIIGAYRFANYVQIIGAYRFANYVQIFFPTSCCEH